jgi:DNA-binding transcriptional regulator YiaG
MTEVEQLRKDFETINARRHSAEVLLTEERAKCFEHMQSIKYLRERFELLQDEFNALKEKWEITLEEQDDADSS